MELRHLRYFQAAAEVQHFGRAADILCVTRPAVSQTIADLEAELGVQLFMRHAQKVTLTAAGTALLRHSKTVIDDLNQAVALARRIGQGKEGPLVVGYGTLSLLHPQFRAAVKQLRNDFPAIELTLTEMPSSLQVQAVRAGKLDAGFIYTAQPSFGHGLNPPEPAGLGDMNSITIQTASLAVAMPHDHPLAGRKELELPDLAGESFISIRKSVVDLSAVQSSRRPDYHFEPKFVQEVANIATQLNLISVGLGIGLIGSSPELKYPDGVKVVPLSDVDYPSRFMLIWKRGEIEPILQNFIKIVRQIVQKN
ncbi:LysR substrate-binding domain-containing protein [Paracoccus sp. J39]|uniref:LysR substrate-binding domain-containing protein n=1 Tax=Paracoccus sp. J39 TaxID=935848 RepID=UPI00048E9361|nr:LysR substrate-binding domain-containing protein [Paracoccus sp. J39]